MEYAAHLQCGKEGRILADLANITLILANDANWEGKLKYNQLSRIVEWKLGLPVVAGLKTPVGQIRDEHYPYVISRLTEDWQATPNPSIVASAVDCAAANHAYNPVQEWLNTLGWDGVHRLIQLPLALRTEESEIIQKMLRWFMVSAVARAMKPGCKADHMLVLESRKQGIYKSTFVRTLASEEWYGELGDVNSKDAAMLLAGKWLVEMTELDFMRGRRSTEMKNFIAAQWDDYRKPYGRNVQRYPRMCGFIGTTNSDAYLQDATGGRRYWPIKCQDEKLDIAWIKKHRGQLWAEALVLYQAGERWWPEEEDENLLLAQAQEERYEMDPWEEAVQNILFGTHITTGEILQRLDRESSQWTMGDEIRISKIVRRLGWRQERLSICGRRARYWIAPDVDKSEVVIAETERHKQNLLILDPEASRKELAKDANPDLKFEVGND